MRLKLTNEALRNKCLAPAPGEATASGRAITQKIYWDTDLRGFGVLVGAQTKTFIAQRDVAGRTLRRKIGRYPTWTVEQARKQARETIVKLDKGEDPLEEAQQAQEQQRRQEWQRFTLRQAIDEHVQNMAAKNCAAGTADQLRRELDRHVGDWMSRPLATISRRDCIERHRKVTTSSGPYVANRVVRELRAVWNSARRLFEDLPPHPLTGVVLNKEQRRREPVPWADLTAWATKVDGLSNPVRRDFNWFVLLTGSRSTAAATLRWENIDFKTGTVHFPKPKGGTERAFTVPLCAHLLAILAQRQLGNRMLCTTGDKNWVFPTFDRAGNVVPLAEPKEQKYAEQADGTVKKVSYLPSPHRLRDTWATAANECGVDFVSVMTLLNHALPKGNVTMGYMRPSTEHLRTGVEKVAAFLLNKAGVGSAVAGTRRVGA